MTTVAPGLDSSWPTDSTLENGPGIANHPVRVIPSDAVAVPPAWPLDEYGAITCSTCHTEIPISPEVAGPKLRDVESQAARPTEFCAKCHSQTDQRNARSIHWVTLAVAHVTSDGAYSRDDGRGLDTQTRQCLSCHDGASASESNSMTPWSNWGGYTGDRHRDHPIAVRYADPSRSKDLSPLRPASLLPPEVPLPGGNVGCVSCHNLYAREEHLLTVPIHGSELCLTCHDMK